MFPADAINVRFVADAYRRCSLVLGMRGHADVIPFGQGVPFIALGDHDKNRWFLEQINEPQLLLNKAEMVDECIDNVLADNTLLERFAKTRASLLHDINAFNEKVIGLLK